MKRLLTAAVAAITVILALACGGGISPPTHGLVAYQTYNGGSTRIKFLNETSAKITWRNMSGPAVEATYTHTGDEVIIQWGEPTNTSTRTSKMRQLDDCQLVQFSRLDDEGVDHTDNSKMFIKDDARCKGR